MSVLARRVGLPLGSLSMFAGASALRSAGVGTYAPFALRSVLQPGCWRFFSSKAEDIRKLRNIGISAHIDSGKTTLTERILYYTGRIKAIHEVRGSDGVGAKMDHMELEREKGITIQSAATRVSWGENNINIIDTPGHVDFTIEVERSLRVLDGAIMVLCGVAGVQSQSITVDRQMKRYNVPRLAFVNKLDRIGSNPWKPIDDLRKVLGHNAAAVQVPIGAEANFEGLVDLVRMKAYYYDGSNGENIRETDVPDSLLEFSKEKRREMIEHIANVDDEIAEVFMNEEEPSVPQLTTAIRRVTLAHKFVPVFMGAAFKNKGVQHVLDGVINYLPSPLEPEYTALDLDQAETPVKLECDPDKPLVALAFKLEEGRFGQLTYVRSYQGMLRKGDTIFNTAIKRKMKVPRLVRMHSNEMEDITEAPPGDIVAFFGVECDSGCTFTDGRKNYSMVSMHVPEPVMSLAITPKDRAGNTNFGKALNRFTREDPTFKVHFDSESKQTIISGMGELHLEIYKERMQREYKVETVVGKPQVNYREAITKRGPFSYLHKKQSGGSGQFGKVEGYVEPLTEEERQAGLKVVFENHMVGTNIPPELIPAVEKGFRDAAEKGLLVGAPVEGVRFVLTDGASHVVDSNEIAFKMAAIGGFMQGYRAAGPQVLEPIMKVEVEVPIEFQGGVVGGITRRRGMIANSESVDKFCKIQAMVPLNKMFGYSTDLRSATEGKGEFSMEYHNHAPVVKEEERELMDLYQKRRQQEMVDKGKA